MKTNPNQQPSNVQSITQAVSPAERAMLMRADDVKPLAEENLPAKSETPIDGKRLLEEVSDMFGFLDQFNKKQSTTRVTKRPAPEVPSAIPFTRDAATKALGDSSKKFVELIADVFTPGHDIQKRFQLFKDKITDYVDCATLQIKDLTLLMNDANRLLSGKTESNSTYSEILAMLEAIDDAMSTQKEFIDEYCDLHNQADAISDFLHEESTFTDDIDAYLFSAEQYCVEISAIHLQTLQERLEADLKEKSIFNNFAEAIDGVRRLIEIFPQESEQKIEQPLPTHTIEYPTIGAIKTVESDKQLNPTASDDVDVSGPYGPDEIKRFLSDITEPNRNQIAESAGHFLPGLDFRSIFIDVEHRRENTVMTIAERYQEYKASQRFDSEHYAIRAGVNINVEGVGDEVLHALKTTGVDRLSAGGFRIHLALDNKNPQGCLASEDVVDIQGEPLRCQKIRMMMAMIEIVSWVLTSSTNINLWGDPHMTTIAALYLQELRDHHNIRIDDITIEGNPVVLDKHCYVYTEALMFFNSLKNGTNNVMAQILKTGLFEQIRAYRESLLSGENQSPASDSLVTEAAITHENAPAPVDNNFKSVHDKLKTPQSSPLMDIFNQSRSHLVDTSTQPSHSAPNAIA